MNSGKDLERLREAAGLSRAELARRGGVTQQGLAGYEEGRVVPSKGVRLRLMRAVGSVKAVAKEDGSLRVGSTCTVQLVKRGGWEITDGVVSLLPLTQEHVAAVAVAGADVHARMMLAHAINLSGSVQTRRRVVESFFLGPGAAGVEPFAVAISNPRSPVGRRRVIGVRWLDDPGEGSSIFGCGGWLHVGMRGQGYGSRALRLACWYAESVRGATGMETWTRCDNLAAQTNLEAVGFVRVMEGEQPDEFETWRYGW